MSRSKTVTSEATVLANKFLEDTDNHSDDAVTTAMAYVLALQIASMSITKGWNESETKNRMTVLFTSIAKQVNKSTEELNPAHSKEPDSKTVH